MKDLLLSWGMLVLSVFFNVYGIFVIKMKMNELGPVNMQSVKSCVGYFIVFLKSPLVLSGVVLFFIAPFLFAIALSRMEIVVAYPAQIGLNFLFLIILAVLILGEQLTSVRIAGMLLVMAGIFLLNK